MNKSSIKTSPQRKSHMKDSKYTPTEATSTSPSYKDRFTSISPNSVKKSYSPGFKNLQQRYRQLQTSFSSILDKTRERNVQYEKQKKELDRYKIIHEKDKREIHKLRGMLGFLPKEDKEVQVNMDCSGALKMSKMTKLESTATNIFRDSKESWFSPEKSSVGESAFIPQLDSSDPEVDLRKTSKYNFRKLSNSPYSKYRFKASLNPK